MKALLANCSVVAIEWMSYPMMQPATIVGCIVWFQMGFSVDVLTNVLSIWAIVLSLMLLTKMQIDEESSTKRDLAIQAKLDELILVTKGARDDLAHVEDRAIEEIQELRQ